MKLQKESVRELPVQAIWTKAMKTLPFAMKKERKIKKLIEICKMKREWGGEGGGGGEEGAKTVMDKLKMIKSHLVNIYPNMQCILLKLENVPLSI